MSEDKNDTLEWTLGLKKDKQAHNAKEISTKIPVTNKTELPSIKAREDLLSLSAGQSEVLVLEDRPIDTKEDDVLFSVSQREKELANKRIAEKQKKWKYTPFEDEDELMVSSIRPRKSILSKYDDQDEEDQKTKFPPSVSQTESNFVQNDKKDIMDVKNTVTMIETDVTRAMPITRRNVRRKIINFTSEPKPINAAVTASSIPAKEDDLITLDDDYELQKSLASKRKRLVAPIGIIKEERAIPLLEGEEEEELKEDSSTFMDGGAVFSAATGLLPVIQPSKVATSDKVQDSSIVVPTLSTEKTKMSLDNVPDRDMIAQLPFEVEPLVRRGVVATLKFLGKLGIRPQLCSEQLPPRQRKAKQYADLKIEHYDNEGNLLTAKEAYKELSHAFHGKAPGKTKMEKKQRKRAEEVRIRSSALSDTPLGVVSAMRERQKATGESHIVLSQGSHAPKPDNAMQVDPNKNKPGNNASSKQAVKKIPRIFGMK